MKETVLYRYSTSSDLATGACRSCRILPWASPRWLPCATAAQAKTRAAPSALLARPPPPRAAACAARTAPSRQTARRLVQRARVHARACLLHVPREPQDAWLVFAELHANCCHLALLNGADAVCLLQPRSQSHVLILSSASHLPRAKSSVRAQ